MNRTASTILLSICLILASFAHFATGKLSLEQLEAKSVACNIVVAIIAVCLLGGHAAHAARRVKLTAAFLGFIFAQFIILGNSVYLFHDYSLCFGNATLVIVWAFQSICYSFVFFKILTGTFTFIQDRRQAPCATQHQPFPILKIALLLIGSRIVCFALFYPCGFGFDAAVGLHTFLNPDSAICDHHPFYVQLLHAICFSFGQHIGHVSLAFAVLTLLFIFFSSAILLYGIRLLHASMVSSKWIWIVSLLYAFFPLFPYLSVYPTKDGIFAYALLLYVFTLYEACHSGNQCLLKKHFLLLHGLAILLVCLSRHQGIYIVILEVLLLLILYTKDRKAILLAAAPPIIVAILLQKVIMPLYDVEPAGKQELYGTLFQQTAYYLRQHPADVTTTELDAINGVINADTITIKYIWNKTDAVKNGYKYNPWYRINPNSASLFRHIDHTGEKEALAAYRAAWFSMFLKHPLTCMQATTYVCSGFFHNNHRQVLTLEPLWSDNTQATTRDYQFWYISKPAAFYDKHIHKYVEIPLLSWILSIPYYNWLTLFFFFFLSCRKDAKGIVLFFPVLLSVCILLICPVSFGRYIFPIIITLPLFAAYLFSNKEQSLSCHQ